jgi:hypothetical protein
MFWWRGASSHGWGGGGGSVVYGIQDSQDDIRNIVCISSEGIVNVLASLLLQGAANVRLARST